MNKVVTIDLNGRAYQLEESGYEALRAYLDEASTRLADDPGKSEIIADLEQAIAEKCDKVLTPYKTVVSNDEVRKIITEMGPVEGNGKKESAGTNASAQGPRAPRRFFLIRQDAVFAGVCAGIAAYFDIDVTIVRVAFVALTVFTGGIWILFYLALALLVPYADTAEAMAQAHGQPFNAEALVQRAKERWGESYERVTGQKWDDLVGSATSSHAEHIKWKMQKKMERMQRKQAWRQTRYERRNQNPVMGFILGALGLMWILALLSLISTGAIFGFMLPTGVPLWVSIVALFILFQALTGPFRNARHRYIYNGQYYEHDPWDAFVGVLTAIFVVIGFIWAYRDVPQFYFFIHHPITGIQDTIAYLKAWWK